MIPDEQVVVTISYAGYIKRTRLAEYRAQAGRCGVERQHHPRRRLLESIFTATNHNWLLIFTAKGRRFWMRIFEVPEGSKQSKGRAIVNLINLEQDDKVLAYIPVQDLKDADYVNENYVILATKKGLIKDFLGSVQPSTDQRHQRRHHP